MITKNLEAHIQTLEQTINANKSNMELIANTCIKCLEIGGKIIILGNGGSAADAQHMAAELVGNFSNKKRQPLAAIALTTDTSVLTSICNDYSFEDVFSRQINALASPKDVVIGITTSGKSANVLKALKLAKEKKCFVVGLSGKSVDEISSVCDINIAVSSFQTSRIQEVHLFIEHSICELIDNHFVSKL